MLLLLSFSSWNSQNSTQKNQVMRARKQEGMVLFVQYHQKQKEEKYRKGTCCLCRCRQCEFSYNFHVSLMMRISTSQSLRKKKMKKRCCCFLPFSPHALSIRYITHWSSLDKKSAVVKKVEKLQAIFLGHFYNYLFKQDDFAGSSIQFPKAIVIIFGRKN